MHNGNDGIGDSILEPTVEPEKGGVIEFILDQYIQGGPAQPLVQAPREIVAYVTSIGPPGKRENRHPIALGL
jgi:hypothetical protein